MTPSPDREIIHRDLNTSRENPVVQITETVADIEDVQQSELTTVYSHLDHVLDYIFDNPPKPEAQVEITFSYEGYRITVEQDGTAQFVKIE